jgi:calcineurin-like phosphoesterase family protein
MIRTGTIFYTADLHLGHENVIAYSNRPFSSTAEMLECIILNWNSVVSADDDVYIIGDMFFKINSKEQLEILRRLKGRKHLILGNHDRDFNSNIRNEFAEITDYLKLDDNGRRVVLSHYPILEWDGYFRGAYHVYGHIHNNVRDDYWPLIARRSRMLNAGVDVNNFEPVTFDEMIANNRTFIESHAEEAKQNPLTMFCLEA